MVLAFLALLWDRAVTYKDRENSEGNRKPTALADDVYEALFDLVECKAQPPVEGTDENNACSCCAILDDIDARSGRDSIVDDGGNTDVTADVAKANPGPRKTKPSPKYPCSEFEKDSQFAITGYKMYRKDRKKGRGGRVVYVRNSILSYCLRIKSNELEAILVDIHVGQQHISLLCGYEPPSVNIKTFRSEMYTFVDVAISNRPSIICLGDLNCDILHSLDNGEEGRVWLDICDVCDLQNLTTQPTRIYLTKESRLDIIATNVPAFELQPGSLETGLNDHKLVSTVLNRKVMKPKTTFTRRRRFKNFNEQAFNNDIECIPFNIAYTFEDVSDICWPWEKLFADVLDDHALMKAKRFRDIPGKSNFITPEKSKAMWKRNALKRKFYQTRSADDWEAYRCQRNRVIALRRRPIIHHFDQLGTSRASSPRGFWKSLRPLSWPNRVFARAFVDAIGHFTVVYLVAKPLIQSEAKDDLVVIETCI
ncbi:hypothetical protein AWC38_SpisGene23600 [Stylophora pistillata]|uniref:Endonuclease/exonuclease/phosphatase domain-containing protein n=1 Tax=Stylophora pistillata TaxID=50429 RepID=A0A2B4R6K8_STYPI|nr:hypothetical protein AWC38_SpisGene23600 [Stylophora pistillata]